MTIEICLLIVAITLAIFSVCVNIENNKLQKQIDRLDIVVNGIKEDVDNLCSNENITYNHAVNYWEL